MKLYSCLATVFYLIKKGCTNFKSANSIGQTAISLLTDNSSVQMTRFLIVLYFITRLATTVKK